MVVDPIFIGWDIFELWNNPTWENAGWLALDVVLAVAPFVPAAAGLGARAAKAGLKTLNTADNLLDTGRVLTNAGDAARLTTRFEDVAKIATRLSDDAVDSSLFWKYLERGGAWTGKFETHHLLPKQFGDFFNNALRPPGKTIDDHTVELERNVHKVIHGKGYAVPAKATNK